ncbi:MAG: VOC family protein [Solirubrobacterales bacterium]|nr:VOC family protein [Solirubrobacterales bacterium]
MAEGFSGLQGERRGELPDGLRLGAAHLKVSELDRSIAFYTDVLGLQLARRDEAEAGLSAGGDELVVLHETPGARSVSRHAGLYHVALLYPSQLELARAAQRIMVSETPIQGASDHGISEAIYLPDPDGNGIELASDYPTDTWPDLSNVESIAPNPLDMGRLFNLVSGREPEPDADPGTTVGHVHLHVGDIAEGLGFYRDLLGFDLVTYMASAAFVSAGGYHHHLAFNIWQGKGAPPAPPEAAGLLYWTIELPTSDDVSAVRDRLDNTGVETVDVTRGFAASDPWGIAFHVISAISPDQRQ